MDMDEACMVHVCDTGGSNLLEQQLGSIELLHVVKDPSQTIHCLLKLRTHYKRSVKKISSHFQLALEIL